MQQSNVTKYSKFLSEEVALSVIKEKLVEHKRLLIKAPTGCGKTYTFIQLAKDREGKTIFLVPNVSNVTQIADEYGIPGVHGDEVKEGLWSESNVVVATYDKAGFFLKSNLENLLIVLDEAHNLQSQANFRSDAILRVKKLVEKSKEAVFLSATINHLKHDLYGEVLRFEPEEPKSIIGRSKILTSGKSSNKAVALDLIRKKVAEGKRCLVKMNHKNTLTQFKKSLEKSKISSEVLTSENKNKTGVMEKLLREKTIPSEYQVIFCTSLLDAGVNLKEVEVVIDIENGDPNAIRQFSARPRVSLGEHYVIIKGDTKDRKPEDRYTREKVEGVIANRLRIAASIKGDIEKCFTDMKDETQKYLRFKFSLVEDTLDEEFYIKEESEGKFYVDVEALRNAEYENYYRSLQTNPELLQKELSKYGLATVIEGYDLKSSGGTNADSVLEGTEEENAKELSQQLKTLQALDTQKFALECYRSEKPKDYFSSNKWSKKVTVPSVLFETFGMYMALGFQYRLAYELMMKSYGPNQKKNKIRSYIQSYVYSRLKDDPEVVRDIGYKSFEIVYNLYEKGATVEEEKKTLVQHQNLLGKDYTRNKLTTRGNELFILEQKSTTKDGKKVHYKESKGLHTAKSILENFNITDQKYIDEFQELLDEKIKTKLVDLYVDKVVAPNAPELNVDDPIEGKSNVYFSLDFKHWMEKCEGEMDKPIPSPYFPEDVTTKENSGDSNDNVSEEEVKASKVEGLEAA
ncbi:hypothetical protein PM10SUCC1_19320 [Propionigenium maris DSM 9537]|uniref:Helicase ATP-binding domain-containing protein n=1 Tax=Propionigenium maris DSM 9537 TaxID=1123000 RepID=A0A9W6LNB4_9FUSO|nr:DEAD/DEAH box helicase [Propionigenium maris]GLI56418.1 hypothetical protein PM10SUCC1_19320 [Propionigenium maris DSM 9537]